MAILLTDAPYLAIQLPVISNRHTLISYLKFLYSDICCVAEQSSIYFYVVQNPKPLCSLFSVLSLYISMCIDVVMSLSEDNCINDTI